MSMLITGKGAVSAFALKLKLKSMMTTKTNKTFSTLLCFLLLIAISGCEKENEMEPAELEDKKMTFSVDMARNWYQTNVQSEKVLLQTSSPTLRSSNESAIFFTNPSWKYYAVTQNEKATAIDIDLTDSIRLDFATESGYEIFEQTGDWKFIHSFSRLVILNPKNGNELIAFIMTIIPSSNYIEENVERIKAITYLNRESNFDGLILFHHIDGRFSNGWMYEKGEITNMLHDTKKVSSNNYLWLKVLDAAYSVATKKETIKITRSASNDEPNDGGTFDDVVITARYIHKHSYDHLMYLTPYYGISYDIPSYSGGYDGFMHPNDNEGGCSEPAPQDTEEIIIDDSFKDTKAECIYNELKDLSGGFNTILQKFDNSFSVAHLKLMVNNNLSNSVFGATFPPQNYIIRIEFNDNRIGQISDLGKATAMIHEMIHAEIYRKLLSAAQKGDLNHDNYTSVEMENYVNSMRNNFPGLYDYYWKRYHPGWGHDMMASHYREIIINVLQQVDNNRLDKNIYEALSWAGLGEFENGQSTVAWQKLSAAEKQRIENYISNYFFNGFSKCN